MCTNCPNDPCTYTMDHKMAIGISMEANNILAKLLLKYDVFVFYDI